MVEYEVTFSSSGVTDRGLVFGAAISIDEEGKGAAGSNGVNEASVHIGSAEGTWKLQFGSNDPGIDLVGNIGVANADDISGMTKTVLPLMYNHNTDATGTPDMRRLMLPPKFDARVAGALGPIVKTFPTTTTTGFDAQGAFVAEYDTPISYIKQKDVTGALKYTLARRTGTTNNASFQLEGTNMPAPPPGGHTAMALTGTIDSFSYALTASEAGKIHGRQASSMIRVPSTSVRAWTTMTCWPLAQAAPFPGSRGRQPMSSRTGKCIMLWPIHCEMCKPD